VETSKINEDSMSKVLSGHLQDEIYKIIEDDAATGSLLCVDELTERIAALFDECAIALCGNLSDGYTFAGIYADFDDAAICNTGESWLMTPGRATGDEESYDETQE
jgi:uncharacterized small protein (DUF1192 family)